MVAQNHELHFKFLGPLMSTKLPLELLSGQTCRRRAAATKGSGAWPAPLQPQLPPVRPPPSPPQLHPEELAAHVECRSDTIAPENKTKQKLTNEEKLEGDTFNFLFLLRHLSSLSKGRFLIEAHNGERSLSFLSNGLSTQDALLFVTD